MSKELEKKWHRLLKKLEEKGILDWEEREYLELESYLEKKREEWWNS